MASAADGPLFSLVAASSSPAVSTSATSASTFADHAARFSAAVDGFRAVCAAGTDAAGGEALRTQGELLVLELKRSARDLHDGLRQGVGAADQAREQVDGVAVQVRRPPPFAVSELLLPCLLLSLHAAPRPVRN
jgi:hypothetical protein|eukprot:COSAG06_NODE_331_length_17352_cov_63.031098_11_plen_134_part_00